MTLLVGKIFTMGNLSTKTFGLRALRQGAFPQAESIPPMMVERPSGSALPELNGRSDGRPTDAALYTMGAVSDKRNAGDSRAVTRADHEGTALCESWGGDPLGLTTNRP